MKKLIGILIIALVPAFAFAAEEGAHLDKVNVDLHDQASLQRGAKLFVNYCLSCHSAAYQRYNRMGKDLGLTDAQVKANLMFASDKIGDTMTVAMPKDKSAKWFGVTPPDLSVIARARGADWLYTYLRSFYLDPKRPFGVNNAVFKDVAMPDVVWELEGLKKPVFHTVKNAEGDNEQQLAGFEHVTQGTLSPAKFDSAMRDLVNYLVYMGEPAQLQRTRVGPWVLAFLFVLLIVSYLLKKEYWKDVH